MRLKGAKTIATILFISDEKRTAGVVQEQLEKLRHHVLEATCVSECKKFADNQVDLVVIDSPTANGASLKSLKKLKTDAKYSETPIVVVTKEANGDDVIEVMKLGAFDHLSAPIDNDELESVVRRAVNKPKQLQQDFREGDDFLLGTSATMRKVEKLIGMAAVSEATVLVSGETGSGKDAVARSIHKHSSHHNQPLTVIDCTAVPEDYGSFQSLSEGSQGTIILDEIGDLNSQMQAMLVRALKEIQTKPSTTDGTSNHPRVIATTQFNLISMVKEKTFREDLFYRLNVIPIQLPPLRERGSDILVLAESFLQQANATNNKTFKQ